MAQHAITVAEQQADLSCVPFYLQPRRTKWYEQPVIDNIVDNFLDGGFDLHLAVGTDLAH